MTYIRDTSLEFQLTQIRLLLTLLPKKNPPCRICGCTIGGYDAEHNRCNFCSYHFERIAVKNHFVEGLAEGAWYAYECYSYGLPILDKGEFEPPPKELWGKAEKQYHRQERKRLLKEHFQEEILERGYVYNSLYKRKERDLTESEIDLIVIQVYLRYNWYFEGGRSAWGRYTRKEYFKRYGTGYNDGDHYF